MRGVILLFLVVYLLNLIPAFAPPTWMVFSYIGFRYPTHKGILLAAVGALAATLGRVTLAKMSHFLIRKKLLSEETKANVDSIKEQLEPRRKLTFGLFLFYALTPLPSNYLFIAYGLTTMRLRMLALPFFTGRVVSYRFWAFTSSQVAGKIFADSGEAARYLSVYFVVSQIFFLTLVYVFARIDWRLLFREKRFAWLKKTPLAESRRPK